MNKFVNNHQQIINRFPGIINMPAHECMAVLMGGGVNNRPIIVRHFPGIVRFLTLQLCCRKPSKIYRRFLEIYRIRQIVEQSLSVFLES